MAGRRKKPLLVTFKDKIWKKINSWRGRALSKTGTSTLIAWCLYMVPNNWVWNGLKDTPLSIASWVVQMIVEWCVVNQLQQQTRPQTNVVTQQRRQCPCVGCWKCNVDASFFKVSGSTGWNWCVRNSEGSFIAAGTNLCKHNLTTLEGASLDILEALREANSRS
jgi:hypothetical protein